MVRLHVARRLSWLALALLGACASGAAPVARPPTSALDDASDPGVLEPDPEFGGEVYVAEVGPPDAPPLVLLHGIGERASRDFALVIPGLSRRFRVLALDLPGFGRSSRENALYTPERYARLVRTIIARHFGTQPVFVVGHSMGGALAIELAGSHPDAVARLALFDVAGVLHYSDYLKTLIRAERAEDGFFTRVKKRMRTMLFDLGAWSMSEEKMRQIGRESASDGSQRMTPSGRAALLFVQHDFGPALRRVQAPVLLGWGRDDEVAPARTADALRYVLKPVVDHEFARSEHVPMQNEPQEVVRVLTAFFEDPLIAPAQRAPLASARVGRCDDERARVFEGDYESIALTSCRRVLLRNVRTRGLRIERSSVELRGVEVLGDGAGLVIDHSEVRWAGGRIEGQRCMDVSESGLNLLAVTCDASAEALRVRVPSGLVASASEIVRGDVRVRLHGRYELYRTEPGDPPARADGAGKDGAVDRGTERSSAGSSGVREQRVGVDLRATDLEGADLRGVDLRSADMRECRLRRADLRGADLRGARLDDADLSEADLRGTDLREVGWADAELSRARYDAATRLPTGLEPSKAGMIGQAYERPRP